jgi:hypothetical protein
MLNWMHKIGRGICYRLSPPPLPPVTLNFPIIVPSLLVFRPNNHIFLILLQVAIQDFISNIIWFLVRDRPLRLNGLKAYGFIPNWKSCISLWWNNEIFLHHYLSRKKTWTRIFFLSIFLPKYVYLEIQHAIFFNSLVIAPFLVKWAVHK